MTPYEKNLIKALRSGDRNAINNAFKDIYETYVKLIAFVVGEYVKDEETVKDLVNETFLKLFNSADKVSENVKYYLVTTAKNLAVDHNKRIKREKASLSIVDIPYEDEYSLDYTEAVENLKKHLKGEEVDIILMHVIYGYTFKEIAVKLGKKQNTVITLYNRAIKRYKKEVYEEKHR